MGPNLNYTIIDEAGGVIELDCPILHIAQLPVLHILDHLRLRMEDDVVLVTMRVVESVREYLLYETLSFSLQQFNFIFNYKGMIVSFNKFTALFSFLDFIENSVLTEEALVVNLAVVG